MGKIIDEEIPIAKASCSHQKLNVRLFKSIQFIKAKQTLISEEKINKTIKKH